MMAALVSLACTTTSGTDERQWRSCYSFRAGVDPNSKSDSGQAPLSLAAENGRDTSQTQSLDEFYISSGISVTREVVRLC